MQERDLVGRQGLFIAEGEVVARVLARSPLCEPLSLLLSERQAGRLGDLLAAWPEAAPIHIAAQGVLDAVAGFHLHRGVLALGRRRDPQDAEALLAALPYRARVVVLYGVSNHDNVGGVFRNAAAFGASAVLLDGACADPLYRKAIRVSVGAALLVPFARLPAEADSIDLLLRHGLTSLAFSPAGAQTLAELDRPTRAAVLLGAEGPGLAPELLARCHTVRIPMAPGFDSLNVAVTSALALHHLR